MRARRYHGNTRVPSAEQYVAKRHSERHAVRESRAVHDRKHAFAIRAFGICKPRDVGSLEMPSELQGSSKPAIHVFGYGQLKPIHVDVSIAKRVDDRRRFVILTHIDSLERVTREELPSRCFSEARYGTKSGEEK